MVNDINLSIRSINSAKNYKKNVINDESIKKDKSLKLNLFLNFIINKHNITIYKLYC